MPSSKLSPFALYRKAHGAYARFFQKASAERKHFRLIEKTDVPSWIEDIYEQLLTRPVRYRKLIARYEGHQAAIEAHNASIALIDEAIEQFDLAAVIGDPEKYEREGLLPFLLRIARDLQRFKGLTLREKTFIEQVNKVLKRDFVAIVAQHALYLALKQALILPKDRYIEAREKLALISKLRAIDQRLNDFRERWYDFKDVKRGGRIVDALNDAYVTAHKNDPLFNDVLGISLDDDQRAAILRDDVAALVVAGAGSGKTLTICGRVKYLLAKGLARPQDVLLLSYSRKSADDLDQKAKRIAPRLCAGTFHKLGLDILRYVNRKSYVVEEQYEAIVERYFARELFKEPGAAERVLTYYALYLHGPEEEERQYACPGDLYADLKERGLTTLKSELASLSRNKRGDLKTIRREDVRSREEVAIANFYFINGIDYEYEHPYGLASVDRHRRDYLPDFYLPDYRIYHEHYGIDENGRAPQYSPAEEAAYLAAIAWKRALHARQGTVCLETTSAELRSGIGFEHLRRRLLAHHVVFRPLSAHEVRDTLHSIYKGRHFQSIIKLIRTFISLYKASYRDEKGFLALARRSFNSDYERRRAELFLTICRDVYRYYMKTIRAAGKIDFDDMILLATDVLPGTDRYHYKYVIVDEFQDISFSRMRFLKAIIRHGGARLFAVGDDWQSIYRFAGSDITIFTQFQSYFGPHSLSFIHATHRNSQELNELSSRFIMTDPAQLKKQIVSARSLQDPVRIFYHKSDRAAAFTSVLEEIAARDPRARILVLGRNNFDIEGILSPDLVIRPFVFGSRQICLSSKIHKGLSMVFSTVHGAKGLEEDNVILINADNGRNGFPNKIEDDPLLDLVLAARTPYPHAEERRLFYVALTRTRTYVYILANYRRPSAFVKEIASQALEMNDSPFVIASSGVSCPRCGSGRLNRRFDRGDQHFIGCSNSPYCHYSINLKYLVDYKHHCPRCGDYLIHKRDKTTGHYILRCHNWLHCRYTCPDPDPADTLKRCAAEGKTL